MNFAETYTPFDENDIIIIINSAYKPVFEEFS